MKTIKQEIVHVGSFGRLDGKKVTITPEIISDLKETFDGKCPITLGHQLADWMPKFGNVKAVEPESTGSSLVVTNELNDLLADAADQKFYTDVSVGIARNQSGKHYLHHLAYLGAVPPKIRDLKVFADLPVCFLGDGEPFPAPQEDPNPDDQNNDRATAAKKILDLKQGANYAIGDIQKTLQQIAAWASEMALSGKIPEDIKAQAQLLADQCSNVSKEEDVELKEENDKLKQELADRDASIIAQAKSGLKGIMAGRIPKGKQDLVLALADSLGTSATIELSDEDGKKEKVSGLDLLSRIVQSIPKPVTEGHEDLGDGEPANGKAFKPVPFGKA
jgi:hypothetical protein